MARNLFSVPIFFIVFRETLEAAIIISVLLGLAEQIVHGVSRRPSPTATIVQDSSREKDGDPVPTTAETSENGLITRRRLSRRLRMQIFLGAGLGLFIAIAIGASFIAVWFTKASNLWSKSEELYEGIFDLIASIMIFFMGVGMLKMDRAKAKWRIKLGRAFEGQGDIGSKTGRWVLFVLPFVTVLREGIEAVVFVGGVSLGQPAVSIPIAAIVGLICGLACGFAIYQFASRTTLSIFLVVMTNLLLLIGAGLFTRAVTAFQNYAFNRLLGAEVDDAKSSGDGPGSYNVHLSVWHLDCCNPENKFDAQGWSIFKAVLGWTNNATVGSILAYVFFWLAVIVALVFMKFREGRTKLLGRESAAGTRRRHNKQNAASAGDACVDDSKGLPS